ncbi:hypothetical protein ACJMK2_044203 [Sinanodonta woodiana]|uniref:Uncharacterized protein n=1 Tax=Sinanodonta woodiana TaxID=1069815 RepID=A0ABD3VZ95_SINWO
MEDILVEEHQADSSADNVSSAQGVWFNNGSVPEVTVKHHINDTQERVSTGEEAREPVTTSQWNLYNNGNDDIEDAVGTFHEGNLNSHNGIEVFPEDIGRAEEQLLPEDLGNSEVDWQSHLDGSDTERVNPKDKTSATHPMPVNCTVECPLQENTDTTYLESAEKCTCKYSENVEQTCTSCADHSSLKLDKETEHTRTVDGCSSSIPVFNNNIYKPLVRVYDTASDNDILDSDDLNCFQEPDSPSDTVIVTIKFSASLKGLVLETTTGCVAARKDDSDKDGIDDGINGSSDIEHKGETSDKQVIKNQTSDVDDDNKDGYSENDTVPQRIHHMSGVIRVNAEGITHVLNERLCNEEANEAMYVHQSERLSSSSDDKTKNGNRTNDSMSCADEGNNSEVDKQTFSEAGIHPLSKSLNAEIEACDDMQTNSNADDGLYCSQLYPGQINECSGEVNCDSYRTLTDPSNTDSLLRSNSFDLKFHNEDYAGTDHKSPCTTLILEDADITNTHSICTDHHAVNAKDNNASDEGEDGEISYIKANCESSSLFDGSMNTNKSETEETVVDVSEHQIDKHDIKVDSTDGESSSTSSPNNCNCLPEGNMLENSCIYVHTADNSVGMTDYFRQAMLHSCTLVLKPEVDVYVATGQDDNEIKIDEDRQEEDVDAIEAYEKSQRTRKKRSLVLEVISDFEGTSGNEIDNTIDLSPDMELSQEETKGECSVCQPENRQTTPNLLADDSNPDRSIFDIRSIFTSERSQDGTPPEEILSDCDESETSFAANRWFGCLSSSSLEVENSSDFESAIEDNISNIGTESCLDTDDLLSVSSSESCGMYSPESSKSSDFESAAEDSISDQSRSISNNSAMCEITRNSDRYQIAQVDDAFGARIAQAVIAQSASNSNALSSEDTSLEFDNGSIPVLNVDQAIMKGKEVCMTFGVEAEQNRSQYSEIEPDKVDSSDVKCQLTSRINEELDFGAKCAISHSASPCHSKDEIKCNANRPIPMVKTLMQHDDDKALVMSESQTFANVQSVIQTDENKAFGSNSNIAMVEASKLSLSGTTENAPNDDVDTKNVDIKNTALKTANTINFEKVAPLKWKTVSILDSKKGTQSSKQKFVNGEKKQIQGEKTIEEDNSEFSLVDYNQARGETFCKESVAETKEIPDSSDQSETVERYRNSFKRHLNWKSLEKSPVDVEMVLNVEKEKCQSEMDEIIVNSALEGKYPVTKSQFLAKNAIVLASPVKIFDEGFLILDAADKTKLQLGVVRTIQPQRQDDLPTAPKYFRGK